MTFGPPACRESGEQHGRDPELRDGIGWRRNGESSGPPPEQEAALRGDVEHGDHESPRDISVDEVAERLHVPRLTLVSPAPTTGKHLAKQYVAWERAAEKPGIDLATPVWNIPTGAYRDEPPTPS